MRAHRGTAGKQPKGRASKYAIPVRSASPSMQYQNKQTQIPRPAPGAISPVFAGEHPPSQQYAYPSMSRPISQPQQNVIQYPAAPYVPMSSLPPFTGSYPSSYPAYSPPMQVYPPVQNYPSFAPQFSPSPASFQPMPSYPEYTPLPSMPSYTPAPQYTPFPSMPPSIPQYTTAPPFSAQYATSAPYVPSPSPFPVSSITRMASPVPSMYPSNAVPFTIPHSTVGFPSSDPFTSTYPSLSSSPFGLPGSSMLPYTTSSSPTFLPTANIQHPLAVIPPPTVEYQPMDGPMVYVNQDSGIPGHNFHLISNPKQLPQQTNTQAAAYASQFGPGGQQARSSSPQFDQQHQQQYDYQQQDPNYQQQGDYQQQGYDQGYPQQQQHGQDQDQGYAQDQNQGYPQEEMGYPQNTQFMNQRQQVRPQNEMYGEQQQQYANQYDIPAEDQRQEQPHLSRAEKDKKARMVFKKYDKDGNGFLDIYEFLQAMNHLGAGLSYADAEGIFAAFDESSQNCINIDQFAQNFCANY